MRIKSMFVIMLLPLIMKANEYCITSFGAIGDGSKLCTESIQRAIDECYATGGGTVIIPSGNFLTGSIQIKSNVTIHLTTGARIIGSTNLEDYYEIGYVHNEMGNVKSLIWAIESDNVSIIGNGEIDFKGESFMNFNSFKVNKNIEITDKYNNRQKKEAVVAPLDRPNQPIFFHKCRNVRIDGISMKNSPCWTLTLSNCFNAIISSILIDNNPQIPNSDGIHLTASKDILIIDCELYAGDDCVAITCITDWDNTSENIVVSNSILSSRSACVRIGHQASKVKNIIVSNLVMKDSNRGIAVFAGKDGYVENISFDGVIMNTQKYAGAWWGKGEPLVIVAYDGGCINKVSMRNINACSENSIVICGEYINDVKLINWDLSISKGNNISHFKPFYELSPAPFIESPDPNVCIPGIFARKVNRLNIDNFSIKTKKTDNEHKFNITPIFLESSNILINKLLLE